MTAPEELTSPPGLALDPVEAVPLLGGEVRKLGVLARGQQLDLLGDAGGNVLDPAAQTIAA